MRISHFDFLDHCLQEMGAATTRASNGQEPPNQTKKLANWVYPLGQLISRNHVLIFGDDPPPLKELYPVCR